MEPTTKQVKKEKSLGPDGLPVKFYKRVWDVVSPTYLKMLGINQQWLLDGTYQCKSYQAYH